MLKLHQKLITCRKGIPKSSQELQDCTYVLRWLARLAGLFQGDPAIFLGLFSAWSRSSSSAEGHGLQPHPEGCDAWTAQKLLQLWLPSPREVWCGEGGVHWVLVLIWHFESCSNVTNNRTGKKIHSESLRKSLLTKLQARPRNLLQIMLVWLLQFGRISLFWVPFPSLLNQLC